MKGAKRNGATLPEAGYQGSEDIYLPIKIKKIVALKT
jgi:hypothetical protein